MKSKYSIKVLAKDVSLLVLIFALTIGLFPIDLQAVQEDLNQNFTINKNVAILPDMLEKFLMKLKEIEISNLEKISLKNVINNRKPTKNNYVCTTSTRDSFSILYR